MSNEIQTTNIRWGQSVREAWAELQDREVSIHQHICYYCLQPFGCEVEYCRPKEAGM